MGRVCHSLRASGDQYSGPPSAYPHQEKEGEKKHGSKSKKSNTKNSKKKDSKKKQEMQQNSMHWKAAEKARTRKVEQNNYTEKQKKLGYAQEPQEKLMYGKLWKVATINIRGIMRQGMRE